MKLTDVELRFTEEKLERAFVELLGNENYPHFHGDSIARTTDEVLIESDLLHYLLTKYESNKTILRWMSDGFILKREDRNQKDIHIELIDYNWPGSPA